MSHNPVGLHGLLTGIVLPFLSHGRDIHVPLPSRGCVIAVPPFETTIVIFRVNKDSLQYQLYTVSGYWLRDNL
jgi:hypothetical protein